MKRGALFPMLSGGMTSGKFSFPFTFGDFAPSPSGLVCVGQADELAVEWRWDGMVSCPLPLAN